MGRKSCRKKHAKSFRSASLQPVDAAEAPWVFYCGCPQRYTPLFHTIPPHSSAPPPSPPPPHRTPPTPPSPTDVSLGGRMHRNGWNVWFKFRLRSHHHLINATIGSTGQVLLRGDSGGAAGPILDLRQGGAGEPPPIQEAWSVAEITETRLYEGMKPVRGGPNDLRLGVSTLDQKC